MKNTNAEDIIKSFHSTFGDKHEIPEALEDIWLLKAIGQYSLEVDTLNYDEDSMEFDCKLERSVVDTLGMMMKQYYQERQVSITNKRVSIAGGDISIDGSGSSKTAEKNHLDYVNEKTSEMINHHIPTAYS